MRSPAETTLIEISERLAEHARQTIERLDLTGAFRADVPHESIPLGCETGEPVGIEPCSCDESLALRARLSLAARGTVALHMFREDGLLHIEGWRDGRMAESYVGVPSAAEALERVGNWLTRS